ncbi:MAG TPA: RNA-binding protein [Candidatus Hydrogenedentes bacterium]|jgi:RNA recognition motif-containing protein|nr:RNA-binding protein [Candidatus Hydrogenedentota bacterium]MDY0031075.1 RNA-binding protein [FCB group bacterium]NLT60680.1 RNA-binding protein [Candidatus Hydrogenedentota bacterium]HNV22198.1 RNA-binding protein [Candidatus Hydrogenedentota bacterium]HNZ18682.1 RNA-binding protein [Candidatus Hydrogenedentota bacterium]
MNIYVGNLSYTTTENDLRKAFEAYGTVSATRVIMDRVENRSRGFGFVEMPNNSEGQAAIQAMDGADLQGRTLKVNEAQPREDRRSRY